MLQKRIEKAYERNLRGYFGQIRRIDISVGKNQG
jgi:hypothetical protein